MSSPSLPPAGWYDDPHETGWRRYWDGAAWTSDRHPPSNVSGPPPAAAVSAAAATDLAAAPSVVVCPLCGRNDMLRTVGSLLDEGTWTSRTTGRSTGYAEVPSGTGSLVTQSVPVTMSRTIITEGRSQLAERFQPPRRPRFWKRAWLIPIWLGLALLMGILFGPVFVAQAGVADGTTAFLTIMTVFVVGGLSLLWTWLVGLVVAFIVKAVTAPAYAARQREWDRRYWRLRSAYYCARDGVAVENGSTWTPESFRQLVFTS
ncbi:DUF2510 domain-containing protein [Microbacterium sp. NPDC019599]|uniref:DUF2510 domain-containing protein n=1 Tax=Microbacterium sp. NPDC019599 TaxID=3154690 RepID=UPI0033F89421